MYVWRTEVHIACVVSGLRKATLEILYIAVDTWDSKSFLQSFSAMFQAKPKAFGLSNTYYIRIVQ